MAHYSKKSLEFLERAARQKRPDWLERNLAEYEDVLVAPTRELVARVERELRSEAPLYRFPRRSIARIRRSRDRAESYGAWFKDWIWVGVTRDSGSLFDDLPNLFFQFAPGREEIFSGGGLFVPSSRQIKQIRTWIDADASALEELLDDPRFRQLYRKGLGDERTLVTRPRGFAVDHPRMQWLRMTGWYVWRPIPQKMALSRDFAEQLAEDWRQVLRLNRVLDRYLTSWPRQRALDALDTIDAPRADWS
jgi:uncharacterized protein (TIGR02453 family)